MTLYMIGLGLTNQKDITLRGLKTLKKCEKVYLENYTSKLQCTLKELESAFDKKIISADRELVEKNADQILNHAKNSDTAFLVVGDPMCATTHIDLRLRAKEKNIAVEVIHNASIISAIGSIGLEVYKFGKITSIPFHNKGVKAPFEVYGMNKSNNLHTLFLLDLDIKNHKFLNIQEASLYLISCGIDEDELAVGCARIGSENQVIKASKLKNLSKYDYGSPPYCIVIPGKMHFMEEDALDLWKE